MSLDAAARAALGPVAPLVHPERIAWVDVESAPRMVAIVDPATGEPIGHYAEIDDDLPMTDAMADKFREVCDGVDFYECEANTCLASRYERDGVPVGATIGWVLAGEADERTEWSWVALVQQGRKVIAVCEACSPYHVYFNLTFNPVDSKD